jgi:hypothetical protein
MKQKSSNKKAAGVLATSEVRNVLCEIANLRDDVHSGIRVMTKLAGIVPGSGGLTPDGLNAARRVRGVPPAPNAATLVHQVHSHYHKNNLLPLRDELRKIWTARDLTAKRWAVLHLAEHHYSWSLSQDGTDLPAATPMVQVVEYLLRTNVHTSICANPQCLTPYFFPPRRGRKYCSDACALPAQRESKRSWWQAHGETWRKARKQKRVRK